MEFCRGQNEEATSVLRGGRLGLLTGLFVTDSFFLTFSHSFYFLFNVRANAMRASCRLPELLGATPLNSRLSGLVPWETEGDTAEANGRPSVGMILTAFTARQIGLWE